MVSLKRMRKCMNDHLGSCLYPTTPRSPDHPYQQFSASLQNPREIAVLEEVMERTVTKKWATCQRRKSPTQRRLCSLNKARMFTGPNDFLSSSVKSSGTLKLSWGKQRHAEFIPTVSASWACSHIHSRFGDTFMF
jgi:hypothetical protein